MKELEIVVEQPRFNKVQNELIDSISLLEQSFTKPLGTLNFSNYEKEISEKLGRKIRVMPVNFENKSSDSLYLCIGERIDNENKSKLTDYIHIEIKNYFKN